MFIAEWLSVLLPVNLLIIAAIGFAAGSIFNGFDVHASPRRRFNTYWISFAGVALFAVLYSLTKPLGSLNHVDFIIGSVVGCIVCYFGLTFFRKPSRPYTSG